MFKIGVLGHRFEIKYILWHTTLTRDQNGRTLLVVLHAQIQSWGNKKLDGGLDWNSDLKRTLMQHPIVVRLFLLCSFLRSEIQIYLIVAAKIFKILSNFSSLFFLLVKKFLPLCIDLRQSFLKVLAHQSSIEVFLNVLSNFLPESCWRGFRWKKMLRR